MAKSYRKVAQDALNKAYERELARELNNLYHAFKLWDHNEIDSWELSDRIHRFHDGPSRDLYKFYNLLDKKVALAKALATGVLKKDEVPYELQKSMQPLIDFFRDELNSYHDNDLEMETR
jgi:hypothetical protein